MLSRSSRNDASSLTSSTWNVSKAPAASGPSWRQIFSVMFRTAVIGRRASLVRAGLEVDGLVLELLPVAGRRHRVARPLPRRDVGEVVVVAQRLALLGLVLGAEVA